MRLTLSTDPAAFARQMEAEKKRIATGLRKGVTAATNEIKETLRGQVRASGFRGERALANAWRSDVFPRQDNGSFRPAGVVWSAAPDIHDSMNRSTPIVAKGGKFLAIPSSVNRVTGGGRGGMRLRVTTEQMAAAGSGAFTIKRRSGPGLLWCLPVQTTRSRQGRVRVSGAGQRFLTGNGRFAGDRARIEAKRQAAADRGFLVMFILVPSVTPRKVLDVEAVRRAVPGLLVKHISAALAEGGGNGGS
jgi:hypothetical protein